MFYTSTYTATGIQRSVDYYNFQTNSISDPSLSGKDANGDFYNPYTFTNHWLHRRIFSPLVGADVTMRNNMQFKFAYNRSRLYSLGLVNTTLTEDLGSEFVVGFGYILKDLKLKVRFKGKERDLKSDLNIRADFLSEIIRPELVILLDDSQITGGQKLFSLKLTADYNISQNFNLKFFYDQMMTKYKISTAFPLSTIRAGLTLHLILEEGKDFNHYTYIYSIEPAISSVLFYPNLYFATLSKIRIFGK